MVPWVLLSALFVTLSSAVYVQSRRRRRRLPPGPKGHFLIGNLLQMPSQHVWVTYTEWRKTWGDIIYTEVVGQPIIILNSHKAIVDLFEKRSAIYSERVPMTMATLSGFGRWVVTTPYTERFHKYRRLFSRSMTMPMVQKDYTPMIQTEVAKYLRKLIESPEQFSTHSHAVATAIIMKVTYGYELEEDDDPLHKLVQETMDAFDDVTRPGVYLVDAFAWLKYIPAWFPGASYRRIAQRAAKLSNRMMQEPFEWMKMNMHNDSYVPTISSRAIEAGEEDEELIAWACASLLAGGSDTVVNSIQIFILLMTIHPEIQARAQAEIDIVTGQKRLPEFADRANLPFVDALIKEVTRWNPVTPLGGPRSIFKDDVYEDYDIPKGSIILPNLWGLMHDESTYKKHSDFNPDRFLREIPEMDPNIVAFGWGRRICPGINLAKEEMFLIIVQTLAIFKFLKPLNAEGQEVMPRVEFTSTVLNKPEPFECRIEPRFKDAAALIVALPS